MMVEKDIMVERLGTYVQVIEVNGLNPQSLQRFLASRFCIFRRAIDASGCAASGCAAKLGRQEDLVSFPGEFKPE